MKILLIALGLLGAGLVALALLAPSGPSTEEDKRRYEAKLSEDGPSGGLAWLGGITAAFSPSATPVADGACSGPHAMRVPQTEKGEAHRLLKPALRAPEGAARLVFQPHDPREDGGDGPYVLCLAAEGFAAPLPGDCPARPPKPKGSLPVGPKGGCLSWEALGDPPGDLDFD